MARKINKSEQLMMDMQRTIKQNTEDIQRFASDIADWQTDMNTKEKKLKE